MYFLGLQIVAFQQFFVLFWVFLVLPQYIYVCGKERNSPPPPISLNIRYEGLLFMQLKRKMVKPLSAMVAYEHVKDQPIWVLHHRLFQTEFYDGKIFYRVEV